MSGRLVILPHKSWNVWNQDNREKVARDERLHREAEEAKAEKAKLLLQEQNLEQLQSIQQSSSTGVSGSSLSSDMVTPFRLFEDLERAHGNKIGNDEYLKEKALKEQIQKKKDGIADWALGEGSYENSKTKPWYAALQPDAGSSSSATVIKEEPGTASASKKVVREISRKELADPMNSILYLYRADYKPKHKDNLNAAAVALDSIECKEPDPSPGSEVDIASDSKKRNKKDKKRHHEKDKEHKSDHKRSKHSTENLVLEQQQRQMAQSATAGDALAALRQKRLEREAIERKRSVMLLASVDIYGPGKAGGNGNESSREYNQQYNPHLARAYKR